MKYEVRPLPFGLHQVVLVVDGRLYPSSEWCTQQDAYAEAQRRNAAIAPKAIVKVWS
jgi:hypothetical protein